MEPEQQRSWVKPKGRGARTESGGRWAEAELGTPHARAALGNGSPKADQGCMADSGAEGLKLVVAETREWLASVECAWIGRLGEEANLVMYMAGGDGEHSVKDRTGSDDKLSEMVVTTNYSPKLMYSASIPAALLAGSLRPNRSIIPP